jgi:hypothetical protein
LEETIKNLKDQQGVLKAELWEKLQASSADPGQVWEYDGVGKASLVKGRVSTKLDKVKLMRSGVSVDIINECTSETTGAPHLRIEPPKQE